MLDLLHMVHSSGAWFAFETVAGPAVVIFGGVLAAALGVPQGFDYESMLLFEVATVAVALTTVTLVAFGFVRALRSERM